MIHVRHEHCAVAAAMAYSRKTLDVGVATGTYGPGLSQLMTALPIAVRAHLPLVIFAGEVLLKSGWYNQGIDQARLVTATGARYHSLHHIPRMGEAVRDAFFEARRDRVPVVIGVPFDLQNQTIRLPEHLPEASASLMPLMSPIPPHPDGIRKAANLIEQSDRIVVLAGMGAVEADAAGACRA